MTQRSAVEIIDVSKITSAKAVLDELSLLNNRLAHTDLHNLLTFNSAYYTVTSVIEEASRAHRFKNPDFIEEFSVCFAIYYFQAINKYSSGDSRLAPAWSKTIRSTSTRRRPLFVSLLMGANAHINYDLPLALADTIQRTKANSFLKDIAAIDTLLMKSGKQILGTFEEPNSLVSFVKRRGRFLYFRPIMYMIFYWRIMAWRKYRFLKKNGLSDTSISKRSTKIADRLLWIGERFR